MPEKDVTKDVVREFHEFIVNNIEKYIPDTSVMLKFFKHDDVLLEYLLGYCLTNVNASRTLLQRSNSEEDVASIIALFKGREKTLYKIYKNTFGEKIDYNGFLFMKLYSMYPVLWNNYIDWLKDNPYYNYNERTIIEKIWETPEYENRILYAFESLIDSNFLFSDTVANKLFGQRSKLDNDNKKKSWLLNQLKNPNNDLNRYKHLVNVVAVVYPEWEEDFIIEFLNINNSIDDFKRLYLFPLSKSWHGSEIPLINEEIEFLEKLKKRIKGIEYLEHIEYINEYIDRKKTYKRDVEIQEYINDYV